MFSPVSAQFALRPDGRGPRVRSITMITRRLLQLSFRLSTVSLLRTAAIAVAAESWPEHSLTIPATFSAGRMHSVIFAALDLDHNGVISASELANAPTALRALDLDGDGTLTAAELRHFERHRPTATANTGPRREPKAANISPGFLLAFTLDANHDGIIQPMEIANSASSLGGLDLDGDGQITVSELRPARGLAQSAQ